MCEYRLRRSPCKNVIGGVCGGIAEYFDVSPTLVRILYIILSLGSIAFSGALTYLFLWILIPMRSCNCVESCDCGFD